MRCGGMWHPVPAGCCCTAVRQLPQRWPQACLIPATAHPTPVIALAPPLPELSPEPCLTRALDVWACAEKGLFSPRLYHREDAKLLPSMPTKTRPCPAPGDPQCVDPPIPVPASDASRPSVTPRHVPNASALTTTTPAVSLQDGPAGALPASPAPLAGAVQRTRLQQRAARAGARSAPRTGPSKPRARSLPASPCTGVVAPPSPGLRTNTLPACAPPQVHIDPQGVPLAEPFSYTPPGRNHLFVPGSSGTALRGAGHTIYPRPRLSHSHMPHPGRRVPFPAHSLTVGGRLHTGILQPVRGGRCTVAKGGRSTLSHTAAVPPAPGRSGDAHAPRSAGASSDCLAWSASHAPPSAHTACMYAPAQGSRARLRLHAPRNPLVPQRAPI